MRSLAVAISSMMQSGCFERRAVWKAQRSQKKQLNNLRATLVCSLHYDLLGRDRFQHSILFGHARTSPWCVVVTRCWVMLGKLLTLDHVVSEDTSCGPSVYTVTQQFIKPVTEAAGNVSWALLKHPEGLVCDVFLTHGWAEGIYEFIDKVEQSWPRGGTAAYVCFLSNPQNLDISDLVRSPKESPFARALESSSSMLVIPNHVSSIY